MLIKYKPLKHLIDFRPKIIILIEDLITPEIKLIPKLKVVFIEACLFKKSYKYYKYFIALILL
jgi:hypothetical protein